MNKSTKTATVAAPACQSFLPVGRGKCGNCGRTITKHTEAELKQPWGVVQPRTQTQSKPVQTEHDPNICGQCAEDSYR